MPRRMIGRTLGDFVVKGRLGAGGGGEVFLAEQLMFGYQQKINNAFSTHIFTNFHLVFPYVIMLIVLLIRPYGIFGTKEVRRV